MWASTVMSVTHRKISKSPHHILLQWFSPALNICQESPFLSPLGPAAAEKPYGDHPGRVYIFRTIWASVLSGTTSAFVIIHPDLHVGLYRKHEKNPAKAYEMTVATAAPIPPCRGMR